MRGEDDLSASVELEKLASKYAGEAINMDRQGSAEMAITRYQRAVEILLKLSTLYPNSPQKKIYVSRVKSYRKRVGAEGWFKPNRGNRFQ